MRLGSPLQTEIYDDWRFVDEDLYFINKRVRDYDSDARLVCQDGSRQLGLARWVKTGEFTAGGCWLLACHLTDPETNEPLVGEPDARVLRDMKRRDYTLVQNEMAWRRKEKAQWEAGMDNRHKIQDRDRLGEDSERFVHAWRKSRHKTQDRVYLSGR